MDRQAIPAFDSEQGPVVLSSFSAELPVNRKLKNLVLQLLDEHRVMTIATNRPDGWPQATIVGYLNDGFLLYCFVARNAQKYANILRDPRVSIAIGSDAPQPRDIKGLSLAARATPVADHDEFDYVSALRLKRHPEYAASPPWAATDGAAQRAAPKPSPDSVVLLRIVPEIISVLDYSKAFGHSDLIAFSERDLDMHLDSRRHRWADSAGSDAEEQDEE
ncbi:pyridoxamine 5'-phosphate oxidase family protein [Bradyrhizobium sp.]|uniref:pyridoxamine 5'-phosphate oxidase family protein n=1 Tax=Bradyrhizobium sp. TaxID=376 RepID=UPI004037AB30